MKQYPTFSRRSSDQRPPSRNSKQQSKQQYAGKKPSRFTKPQIKTRTPLQVPTNKFKSVSQETVRTGIRINKYLAEKFGITRKEADTFITDGLVHIVNSGRTRHAKLGDQINPAVDNIILNQKKLNAHKANYIYFAYNKPIGIVTHSPTGDELDIKALLAKQSSVAPHITQTLFPIGRLDKKSTGLIVLTNDGRMSDLMLNPVYEHEKEYVVTTAQDIPSYFKKSMEKGVNIGDHITKPCAIELRGPKTFSITLTEGKRHQIRRMCEAMKTDVKHLERTRIMNIRLGSLKVGALRKIEGKELETFLKGLK
jgi:23S rRNA pseudouridine2604 synthase